MRKLLIIFAALAGSYALLAQDTASERATEAAPSSAEARSSDSDASGEAPRPRSRRRRPMATPVPATPTPTPPKRSLLGRIFGGKVKATPAPAATPVATPPPRSYRRKSGTSSTAKSDTSDATKTDTEKPEKASAEPAEKRQADVTNVAEAPAATPTPKKTSKTKEKPPAVAKSGPPEPPAGSDPEVVEKFRYDQAKAKALEDSDIQELKQKADNSTTEEESKKASRAYNKALFNKMRRIDGSLKDRIDRMEAAMMKRFEE